jgi:hypothetical protein
LSEIPGSPFPAGTNPIWVVIDAQGHFLYTPNHSNDITAYQIDTSTGVLTAVPGQPFFSGIGANSIALDPTNTFIVGANVFGDTVSSLRVDSVSGALLQSAGSPYPSGGSFPITITVVGFPDNDTASATLFSNTFTGNQTVVGNVAATLFSGNGSGLTNVNAASLGGITASNYARLDIGNTFVGNQNFSGNQAIAGNQSVTGNSSTSGTTIIGSGGTPILKHLSATFNPAFGALKATTCATATLSLTGANDGDTVALGIPNARTTGGGNVLYFAWVSAANSITIEACNVSASPQKTAGSGAIRVDVWKH